MIEDLALQELKETNANLGAQAVSRDLSLFGHLKTKLEVVVGSAEISLGELMQLKSGSVFKLIEDLDAPMQLKMDGKVIALGNLVVIDENFGFEVIEVIE